MRIPTKEIDIKTNAQILEDIERKILAGQQAQSEDLGFEIKPPEIPNVAKTGIFFDRNCFAFIVYWNGSRLGGFNEKFVLQVGLGGLSGILRNMGISPEVIVKQKNVFDVFLCQLSQDEMLNPEEIKSLKYLLVNSPV